MTRKIFRVPDIGEGTAEVELVKWYVSPGDDIQEDQVVAELMTEKATVETPSPFGGRVVALHGIVGQMLAVGAPLVEFDIDGDPAEEAPKEPLLECPPTPADTAKATATGAPNAPVSADKPLSPPVPSVDGTSAPSWRTPGEKPVASPAVRAQAHLMGVPLQFVTGSGPSGRITREDLDAHVARAAAGPSVGNPAMYAQPNTTVTDVPVIGLRRRIAQQMLESTRRIPHFTYIEEVDVTQLEEFRQYLNENRKTDQGKLTLLPFLIRAIVKVLPRYPQINARFDDEQGVVRQYGGVHVGIATQTANGLIVPVIRHAETLDLWALAREIGRAAAATRAGIAKREELSGSTITITSLGPLGGIAHTPVINHPEVAIVGPNKIIERIVVRDDKFVARKVMNVSSSFDHRVVDGWDAAEFIQNVRKLLERPLLLFLESA